MYKLLKIFSLILFASIGLSAQSQERYKLISRHINQENGLTNLLVHHTLEDSRGLIWISTNGGLFVFDGKRARAVITDIEGNSFKAGRIYEGPERLIWVNRYGHAIFSNQSDAKGSFAIWNSARERVIPADSLLVATEAPFNKKEIVSISGTPEKNIVFLLHDGRVFSFDGKAYDAIFQTAPNHQLYTFYTAGKDFIFESMDSCHVMSPPFQKQKPLKTFPRSRFKPTPCSCKYKTEGHFTEIQLTDGAEHRSITIPKPSGDLLGASYSPGGYIWIVTTEEVAVYTSSSDHSKRYGQKIASAAVQLSSSTYFGVRLGQAKQEAWIASANGVYLFKLKPVLFERIHSFQREIANLRGITSDEKGKIYYNDFYTYLYDSDTSKILFDTRGGIHLLYEDGILWSGTYRPDILKGNTVTGTTQLLKADAGGNRVSTNWVHRSGQTGILYVGSSAGLLYKPHQKDTLIKKHIGSLIDRTEIRSIHENSEGLWLCTNEGLLLYQESIDTFQDYRHITDGTTVNHLYEAPDGTFWLGTFGKGLYRWQPGAPDVKRYNYQVGFSDDRILAIYPDKRGFLWMPTYHGLIRFHPESEQLFTFTTKDGLPYNEFNLSSHHQLANGHLLLGTLRGIVKFDPLNIPESIDHAYPVWPLKIELFDADGIKKTFPAIQSAITLSSSNDKLSLEFAILDYAAVDLEQFDYRLIGQNNQWTPMRGSDLDLSGFSKGQFTLEVRGRKGKDAYSTDIYRLDISVPPPFYQSTAFIFWSVLSVIATLVFFFRWRTRRLRKDGIRLRQEVRKRTHKIQQQAMELQKLNQVKTTLITNIAHEFKTPLTMISGALQLLHQSRHPNPERGLKTIESNSTRLTQLIDQLVEVNKQDEALLQVQSQPVDLKKLVREIGQIYEDNAAILEIGFSMNFDERLASRYLADPLKLEYMLHNLLSNAFKFTSKGGRVCLSVATGENEQGITLSVEDTGIGISEADQPRIFDRFFQVDATSGGMGIGLAIVKDYTEAMNGAIRLESRREQGTKVTILLPLQSLPDTGSSQIHMPPSEGRMQTVETVVSHTKNQQPLIFIVEDNPEVQLLLKTIFEAEYELQTAADGEEALLLLEQSPGIPDLIITDLMMPELDGVTLIQRLKADERFRLTPILVLSAKSDSVTKIKVLNIGVDDYIQKPFNIDELQAIVQALLKNASARLNAQIHATAEPSSLASSEPSQQEEMKQHEQEWLNQVESTLWNMIDKGTEIKVKDLALELYTSERQLQRQIKLLTGLTPSEYINEVRLQKARQLIVNGSFSTVSEVAYHLGYAYPNYFSRVFTKRFGRPPSSFFTD